MASTRNTTKCSRFSSPKTASTRALIFRLVLLLYIATVAYLCFTNLDKVQDAPKSIFGIPTDKIVHFAMFFPLPILATFAMDRKMLKVGEAVAFFFTACSLSCIFAGLTEIIQGMLPCRSEDIADFATDCAAICLSGVGILIYDIIQVCKAKNG